MLTKIFLTEIERLLLTVSGGTPDADIPRAACPRLGGISFLHRFGSTLNHHVHLHACVTDGVFVPAAAEAACDTLPAFLPARPITHGHLAALGVWLVFYQEKVADRFWAKGKRDRHRLLTQTEPVPAAAAADMLTWENSGFSVDASVRITLNGIQLRVYCQHLEHLLRYCARGCCDAKPDQKPRSHDTSRIAWAKLMARVGEEFPLECPNCGGDIRLIALHQSRGRSGRFSHTSANHSSRLPSLPLVARPPTGASSCRSMTTATSFKRRIDELPSIDIHSL